MAQYYRADDGTHAMVPHVAVGTCPDNSDSVTMHEFKNGERIHHLRNTNGELGGCYTDRTMKEFVRNNTRDNGVGGPMIEDMSSFEWPDDWDTPGDGGVVVRLRNGVHQREPIDSMPGRQDITAAYILATEVPAFAFEGCTALEIVSLPHNLVRIGYDAFKRCPLKRLILPAAVQELKVKAVPLGIETVTYLALPEGQNTFTNASSDRLGLANFLGPKLGEGIRAQLCWSCLLRNDFVGAEASLPSDPNLAMFPEGGDTLLMIMVSDDNVAAVEWLLDHGADVDKAADGVTPLVNAIFKPTSLPIVRLLLQRGADPNVNFESPADGQMSTPLYEATLLLNDGEGVPEVVKLLVEKGADVNTLLPLYVASSKGHTEVVQFLLEAGADPNADTALCSAAYGGHEKIVKLLIEAGANVNEVCRMTVPDASTPLIFAVRGLGNAAQKDKMVKMLLAAGADPTVRTNQNRTALDYALRYTKALHLDDITVQRLQPRPRAAANAFLAAPRTL